MKGLLFDVTPENVKIVGDASHSRVDFYTNASGDVRGWRTDVEPEHVLMDDAGRSTLVFGERGKTLVRHDTDTGAVLNHFHLDAPAALQWTPENKFANMAPIADSTLSLNVLGKHTVASFDVDTRVKWREEQPLPPTSSYTYSPGITLTCMVPSVQDKRVVVGDTKGVVRIYDDSSNLKRADVVLGSVHSPIISIDTTGDGQWVAWATDSAAFLCNVENDKRQVMMLDMPVEEPRIHTLSFDNNGESGHLEKSLVATGTECVVRWRMRNLTVDYKRDAQSREGRGVLLERETDAPLAAHAFEHADDRACNVLTERMRVFKMDV